MRNLVRPALGLVFVIEAMALFVGAALHLGLPLPIPLREIQSLPSAVLEAATGVFLLIAAAAVMAHSRRAWKSAVVAHVAGVASIAFGIASRAGGGPGRAGHHPEILLVFIVVLVVLSTPFCRQALANGHRRRSRRRRAYS